MHKYTLYTKTTINQTPGNALHNYKQNKQFQKCIVLHVCHIALRKLKVGAELG